MGKAQKLIQVLSNIRFSNLELYADKIERNITKNFKPFWFSLLNKSFKAEDALLIFSENRGGSTWLMETLQKKLDAVTSFEPLYGREGKFPKYGHHFSSPFYFGDEQSEEVLYQFLKRTFKGLETSSHSLQFNSFRQLKEGQYLLVKMVNVNLIAPWVASEFDFKHKPIYLLRHPLAILASKMKYNSVDTNGLPDRKIDNFNTERIKSEQHPYLEYLDIINSADTRYKRFLVEWCICNKDFLAGTYDDKVLMVYYEGLVLDEQKVLNHIFREWNMPELVGEDNVESSKASGTTAIGEKVLDGYQQLQKWCDFFSESDKKTFQEIFNYFDIETYNAKDPLPSHLYNKR